MKRDIIKKIAREILDIQTIEIRGRDHLDVHELSVSEINEALESAFNAGKKSRR